MSHRDLLLFQISNINDEPLRMACLALADDYADFYRHPASLSFHHAYDTGLIQHTLEVNSLALHAAQRFPDVNKDILIAAALWHDIGKIWEYRLVPKWEAVNANERHCDSADHIHAWVFNPQSKYRHSHISTSATEFVVAARKHYVSRELEEAVYHCILSHHGPVKEWGSPVAPMTIEALLLHQADNLSAKFGPTK